MKINAQFKGPQTAADVKIGQVVIAHTRQTQECFLMRTFNTGNRADKMIQFVVIGCRVGADEPGYFQDGCVAHLDADAPVTLFDVISPLRLVERTKTAQAEAPEPSYQELRDRPISLCACERCVGLRMSIKAAAVNPSGNTYVARHHANCGCMVCEVNRINASFDACLKSTPDETPASNAGAEPRNEFKAHNCSRARLWLATNSRPLPPQGN